MLPVSCIIKLRRRKLRRRNSRRRTLLSRSLWLSSTDTSIALYDVVIFIIQDSGGPPEKTEPTCSGLSPGGTQEYSSSAHPESLSEWWLSRDVTPWWWSSLVRREASLSSQFCCVSELIVDESFSLQKKIFMRKQEKGIMMKPYSDRTLG